MDSIERRRVEVVSLEQEERRVASPQSQQRLRELRVLLQGEEALVARMGELATHLRCESS